MLAAKEQHLKSPLYWNEEAATTVASSNASKMTTGAKQRATSPHFTSHASPDFFKGIFEEGQLAESRHKSNLVVDDLSPFKDWTGASDREIMRVKPFDESMTDEGELRMIDDNEAQSSTDSGFEPAEHLLMGRRDLAKEFDRFIPQRHAESERQVANFEAKELLFSETQFGCRHSAHEICDC